MRGESPVDTPRAEDIFLPAFCGEALPVAKRQLVREGSVELVGHVERGQSIVLARVFVVLDYGLGASTDRAGIIERF